MYAHGQVELFDRIRASFQNIGYTGELIKENYSYVDVSDDQDPVKSIPLATFSQSPPSYRTASFGVAASNGHASAEFIQKFRSLGAPQIFEVSVDKINRWKIKGQGMPYQLGTESVDDFLALFDENKTEWSPQGMMRAKLADDTVTQLDFIDTGLLPILTHEVCTRLDMLLRDTIGLAIQTFKETSSFEVNDNPPLFRLIFRLIASKILADRGHPGDWENENPQAAINAVESFYFQEGTPEEVLSDPDTQEAVWERIRNTFHFQNISVDALAYVYENTLVTAESRRLYGIHSTPAVIAEYIVRKLPIDSLELYERRVFEPFSGHSVFLVATMQRLRELLPQNMNEIERHNYFTEVLSGIELDPFAREVARLSLMLADYPNSNGWRLHGDDAFASPNFETELKEANIVLCNPPFERFSEEEKENYNELSSSWKYAEALLRVLQYPPAQLGFVVPQVFLRGTDFSHIRALLGSIYSSFDLLILPENVFQHSESATALLIASKQEGENATLRTEGVHPQDLERFYTERFTSYQSSTVLTNAPSEFAESMWQPQLDEVWQSTSNLECLSTVAVIRTGVRNEIPLKNREFCFFSNKDKTGFAPGVREVKDTVEPFFVSNPIYLNMSRDVWKKSSYWNKWKEQKLIVNVNRQSRGNWKLSASVDYEGLYCFRNFYGIWPKCGVSLEVLAAVLNGPVANAFLSTRGSDRHMRIKDIKEIPIPEFSDEQKNNITSLVSQYIDIRQSWLKDDSGRDESQWELLTTLLSIDAEVLRAYDFSPRIERILLDYFYNNPRIGPIEFNEYFPLEFKPFIPLHRYISEEFRMARADETLKRIPVLPEDPLIDEYLSHLD